MKQNTFKTPALCVYLNYFLPQWFDKRFVEVNHGINAIYNLFLKDYQRTVYDEGKSLLIPDCDFASLQMSNSHHNILLSKSMKFKFLLISDCDGVGQEGVMDTNQCGVRKSFSTSTILLGKIVVIVIMVIKMMTMMTMLITISIIISRPERFC